MIASQTNADPHVACRHRLLTAYAWFVASRPIEGGSNPTSSAHNAALAVNRVKRHEVARILALPAPVTLDGLRVFGLALALSLEGTSVEGDTDIAAARAILSATQETLPPGFTGFGDEPDHDDRDRAAWTGTGSLPAWARNGKATPEDADFLTEAQA